MSKSYTIENVSIKFKKFIKTDPRYRELSMNKATHKLTDDLISGKLVDIELKERVNRIEDMIYGKRKKKGII